MFNCNCNLFVFLSTIKKINKQWKTPAKKVITKAAINSAQVAIALNGGELFYFELDKSGVLNEVTRKDIGSEISSLALGPVPEGQKRSRFLVNKYT